MSLNDQLKTYLEKIKEVKGVENAVLTQRDGNPIQSTGVWLSKDEVFNVSSATSAIYNLGLSIHQSNLKYILIEGTSAKIFLAPLKNSMDDPIDRIMMKQGIKNNNEEFFIAITAQPTVNLGAIFLQTRECLRDIKRALVLSGESFKPPLRKYEDGQINSLIKSFNVKENTGDSNFMTLSSFCFSTETINKVHSILLKMQSSVLGLKHTSVTTSGGFLVSTLSMESNFSELDFEQESAMTYSLFSTSNRCAWLLKKMKVNSILLECEDYFQFISSVGDGIFCLSVDKGQQKLGLLRLLLPQYLKVLEKIIKDAKVIDNPIRSFDLKSIIGEIYLK
jgi:predicted regulator of Ras-like GTPase activity (Roadblock/LC7/MglB family)